MIGLGWRPANMGVALKVNDKTVEKVTKNVVDEDEIVNDEIEISNDMNNLTIIGQSEINKLSGIADANGVLSLPQTLIRLRNSKEFVDD